MTSKNWKRNLLKIPDSLKAKIEDFEGDQIVVACAKKIPVSELREGGYSHLGLELDADGQPVYPEPKIPSPSVGRYSKWNAKGRIIKRKDLPKVPKTYSWEVPNWGDWSKGSHTIDQTRMVYQKEQIPPKNLSIEIKLLGREVLDEEAFAVKFEIDQVLDRAAEDFEDDLLFALNVLQENTGHSDVYPSGAPKTSYLDSLFVDWEILPPGTEDRDVDRILSGVNGSSKEHREELVERYEVLADLDPETYVQGRSGFERYFGAKFSDDLVVFENTRYGNAVYVMYDNWEELSQMSRTELLRNHSDGFDRIEHRNGWKHELRSLISQKMDSQ